MEYSINVPHFFRFFVLPFVLLILCGCPKPSDESKNQQKQQQSDSSMACCAEKKADTPTQPSKTEIPSATTDAGKEAEEQAEQKPRDLGPPLVEKPENLTKLHPEYPVWINKTDKQVVLLGSVCKADYPLEFFATYPEKSYESVVVIYTKPYIVHAALVALGAKPGAPVQYEPNFTPPSGTEIEIDVAWKDQDGKPQKAKAQEWVREIKTKKQLAVNWVFAGSMFWKDKSTGTESYLADRGDFITVLNLPTAMLDVPIQSVSAIESRLFEGNTEKMPPPGTPVTLILKPKNNN